MPVTTPHQHVGMCMVCDGYSEDEIGRWYELTIAVHGWAIAGVEDDTVTGWAYTVGLVEGFDHPELLVVGMDWGGAKRALNELGALVREGHRFGPSSVAETGDHLWTFGPIHPDQFDHEGFNIWTGYYEEWRQEFVPRVALQVFPPRCLVTRGGDPQRWRLDTPAEVLGEPRPRNERRR